MRFKTLPKKGDLRDLNNWRGIMLLDAASKVVSMIINSRLQLLLKEVGIEEQNGFMGGRGGSDGIFCIRQALKKRREHGKESWVLFVDLVKAFDSVPRDVLLTVLAKFSVPPHLVSVIKRMNTDLKVSFDLNGEPVAVPCTVGVKQGCPLSPTLFLCVMQASNRWRRPCRRMPSSTYEPTREPKARAVGTCPALTLTLTKASSPSASGLRCTRTMQPLRSLHARPFWRRPTRCTTTFASLAS